MKIREIKELNDPEVEIYTGLNEKQVKKIFEPDPGLFICESEKVIQRAFTAGYEPVSFFADNEKRDIVTSLIKNNDDIPVFLAETDVMKNITGYALTGGILAAMKRKPQASADDFLASHEKLVILDDIENPTNIGAIFRSAAALGADGILLTPGCADPLYRRAARVSMGTVFQVDWTFVDNEIWEKLTENVYYSYGLALADNAVLLNDISPKRPGKRAVALGNEDHGLSQKALACCDKIVMIPMERGVDSLNVAAASAVAFWELFKD